VGVDGEIEEEEAGDDGGVIEEGLDGVGCYYGSVRGGMDGWLRRGQPWKYLSELTQAFGIDEERGRHETIL